MNIVTGNTIRVFIITVVYLIMSPIMASADDFDGSRPLICASIQVYECLNNSGCTSVTAEEVNLPQFLKINFKDQIIRANLESGKKETSQIKNIEHINGHLILSGSEDGLGWSIAISKKTGKFVLTASGDQVGFVVFGASTQQ